MTRRLTRHNGRFGKNGVYNSRHNDRRFRLQNSEHIDQKRTAQNIYWDCYNGIYHPGSEQKKMPSFEQVEKQFYEEHYRDYSEKQNARNEANRHPDKNRTVEQIRLNKKPVPKNRSTKWERWAMLKHLKICAPFFSNTSTGFRKVLADISTY